MTETLTRLPHDIERQELQARLATIDRDPEKLQGFIRQLYLGYSDNPQMFYAAATHLTALSHLDRRDEQDRIILPDAVDAGRAFLSYAQLLAMLGRERDVPRYSTDIRLSKRLVGSREELAFHAVLTYAGMQGADFVTLPSPAKLDFRGASRASDLQVFFAGSTEPDLEMQIKTQPNGDENYDPHIAVLNLADILGDSTKAGQVRGMLKDIGSRDEVDQTAPVTQREHDILLNTAGSILDAAHNWGKAA
jgi:hypothetical protein